MGLYIEAVLDKRAKINDDFDEIIGKISEEKATLLKQFCKESLPVLNHDDFEKKEDAEKELLKQCLMKCPEFCYFLESE